MSSDGSGGRRDGFDRWVASMKREQQPMQERPASLKDMDKLELDLDENATHVHRIPKDVINRMREQRAQERQAQKPAVTESVVRPAPIAAPARSAPAPAQPAFESQVQQAFGGEDEDFAAALGGVSDDRTAVFRPPPELLARAKRMKPPAKPNPNSELPTKPPPAGELGGGTSSLPASAKLPAFESAPVVARTAGVAARTSVPVLTQPLASSATATAAHIDALTADALAEQPSSSPEIERSAVFAQNEPTSGVMSHGAPEASAAPESSRVVALTAEEPVAPLLNDALLLAMAPPAGEAAAAGAEEEEAPAPTTTSPMVRSERSVAPEGAPASSSRLVVWLVAALAAGALVYYRLHHGF